jgi:GT2 family glycosyltransferase
MCVDALCRQTYAGDNIETIVVDNGSTEAELRALRSIDGITTIIEHPEGGSYAARNAGLTAARGEVIAFTDADCVPSERWLEAGLDCLKRDPSIGIVAGRIDLTFSHSQRRTPAEAYEELFAFPQRRLARRGHGVTANWFSWKLVLEEVGRFDASLYSNGDTELAARISRSGLPVVYCHKASVKHPARRRMADIRRKSIRIAEGNVARIPRGSVRGPLLLLAKNVGWHVIRCAELLNHVGRWPVRHLWNAFLVSHVVMATRLIVVARWLLTGRSR